MNELYNLQELANKALVNLNSIGIYPSVTPNNFTINKRARKRYGQAKRHRNSDGTYDYSVNISAFLLDKRNDINSVYQTIYHEYLHCCDECWNDGHKGKWLEYAEKVNKAFKVNVSRCSSFSERLNKEVYAEKKERDAIKKANRKPSEVYTYRAVCTKCNRIIGYKVVKRAPKWYMHPQSYQCRYCHTKTLSVSKDEYILKLF